MAVTKDDKQGGLVRDPIRALGMRPSKPATLTHIGLTSAPQPKVSTPSPVPATFRDPIATVRVKNPAPLEPRDKYGRTAAGRATFARVTRAMALGKLPESIGHLQLQQAGLIPGLTPDPNFDAHGHRIYTNGLGYKMTRELFQQIAGLPAVPFVVGKAALHDLMLASHGGAIGEEPPKPNSELYSKIVKPVGVSFKDTAAHPLRDPLMTGENAVAALSLGAGAVAKAGSVAEALNTAKLAAAEQGGKASVGTLASAALRGARTSRSAPIVAHVPGNDGEPVAIRVTRSKNELVNVIRRARTARETARLGTMKGQRGTTSALLSTYGSPEARVGRVLAQHNAVEHQLLDGVTSGLAGFHRKVGGIKVGRGVLSDAEQKALDIASTHGTQIAGDAAAVREAVLAHRLYHANAETHATREQAALEANMQKIRDATRDGDEAALKAAVRERARLPKEYGLPEHHVAQENLAKLAEPHLLAPSKRLQEALVRVPAVVEKREQMLEPMQTVPKKGQEPTSRLDETRQNYRLGARHLEIVHGARGVETPLQELERLKGEQAQLENLRSSKTGVKVEMLQKMLDRVQKARTKRGGPEHAAELAHVKSMLDDFTKRYGPIVKVLGAKGANDMLQEQGAFGRVIHAPMARESPAPGVATAAHTLESAKVEHAAMAQKYQDVLGRFVLGEHYAPGKPLRDQYGLGAVERHEQLFRNTSNGIYRKAAAGQRVAGGAAALRRGFLPNVKDQLLKRHESEMHDFLHERAKQGDEFAQRFLAHHERMTELGNAISTLEEHKAFGGTVTPEMESQLLGERSLPVKQTVPDTGAEVKNVRPRLTSGAMQRVETKSMRAGEKLAVFHDLDTHEAALKDALNKIVGGSRQKPGARLLHLLATEDGRQVRMSEVRHDMITAGKMVRDLGGFYVPARSLHDVVHAGAGFANQGEFGFGPGSTRLASLDKEYTGALERQGNLRTDVTNLTEETHREAAKLETLNRGFKTMWSLSKRTVEDAGGPQFAVPIRATPTIPTNLRRLMHRALFHGLTADEEKMLPPHELEHLREYLFPSPENVNAATNLTKDGIPVRWIDSREADAFVRRAARGTRALKIGSREVTGGQMIDAVNNPFRAALLYTKPAYALNLLQGLGTNLLQQGVFLPSNIERAWHLGRDLGWEDQHKIFSLMGEGASRAIDGEAQGFMSQSIHHASGFWNVVVDRLPRVTSFLHEARRMGYKTTEDLHRLLNDEKLRDDLYEIHDRANKEAIDYTMTPIEKASLRRMFFFYPWLRGATLWSLRFPREHPLQTALYAPLAEQGAKDTQKALGEVPSYADSLIKVGGSITKPLVINPGNLNNFQTFADVVKGIAALATPGSPDAAKLAGELGPLASTLYTLLSGKDSLGHDLPPGESRLGGAGKGLVSSLPPAVFAQRIGRQPVAQKNPAKEGLYVTPTSAVGRFEQAAEQYAAGGLVPRELNKPAAHAKAETETVAELGSQNANAYHYGKAYDQVGKVWPQVAKLLPAGYDKSVFNKQVVQDALDTQGAIDQHLYDYAKSHGRHSPQDLSGEETLGVVAGYLEAHPVPGLDQSVIEQTLAALRSTPQQYRDEVAKKLAAGLRRGSGRGMVGAWERLLKQVGVPYEGPKG